MRTSGVWLGDLIRDSVCTREARTEKFLGYNVPTVKSLHIISKVVKSHGQISEVKSGQIFALNKKLTTPLVQVGTQVVAA